MTPRLPVNYERKADFTVFGMDKIITTKLPITLEGSSIMNYDNKCPNCGNKKHPLNACSHCGFSWSGKRIKPIARKKENQVKALPKMKISKKKK